jgi:hypothetical protein
VMAAWTHITHERAVVSASDNFTGAPMADGHWVTKKIETTPNKRQRNGPYKRRATGV